MAKTTTIFEGVLKECSTVRQVFETQTALADGLDELEVLRLRAKYAGLTLAEARDYQKELKNIKAIENKSVEQQLRKVNETLLSILTC